MSFEKLDGMGRLAAQAPLWRKLHYDSNPEVGMGPTLLTLLREVLTNAGCTFSRRLEEYVCHGAFPKKFSGFKA